MNEILRSSLEDGGSLDRRTLADAHLPAELLASIVQHIPHGVSVYGPDRRLRFVNTAYARIMEGAPIQVGDTVETIIDRRARAGEFGPGDPAEIADLQRAHDPTRPQQRRRQRPNGAVIDVRTTPLPDGGHISVVTDVTPLVVAEQEAAHRAEDMAAMLANIRHGIVLWDSESRVVTANGAVARMFGARAHLDLSGRTLAEMVQRALDNGMLGRGPDAVAQATRLLEQDRAQSHYVQALSTNGRVIDIRSDPVPQGGFVTTYTDVTQAREAEDALRLAKTAAEAANAAKSRFLATMSTELRTPLTAILTQVGGIARDGAGVRARQLGETPQDGLDAAEIEHSCDAIADSARRLMGLIDTVLDVARLEAGRFDLSEDVLDVPQLVRLCLRRSDAAAAATEVALVTDLPDDLPRIRGDERRIRQALGNLVANAVRFTGAMGSVSVGARQEWTTGDLLIMVEDTGVGIPDAELERVFEPFTQLQPVGRTEPGAGAGLGLYISRTLMRAHGGDLVLRSVAGQGTTAILRFPATRLLHEDVREPT